MTSSEHTLLPGAEDLVAAFFDAADVLCGVFELVETDYRYLVANPAAAAFYGKRPADLIGRTGRDLGLSEAQVARRMQTLQSCWREQRPVREEYRFEHGGRSGWFLGSFTPLSGERPRVGFVLLDISRQKAAERALTEQGRKLQVALASAQLGLWEYDIPSNVVVWDGRMRNLFGVDDDEAVDFSLYERLLHPEDRAGVLAAYEAALAGEGDGGYQLEHRTSTGRWVRATGQVVFDRAERPIRALGTARDITGERAAREQEQLLLAELNHRVKNNLATVQSIAQQTARTARDLPAFAVAFEGRLLALARTHDVLTATAWSGANLTDVLHRETAAFGEHVTLGGPPVGLTATQAVAVGMIVHELSTNAAKYGALTSAEGCVEVTWSLADRRVSLSWVERGGPGCQPPRLEGFGSRLMRRLAAGELRGALDLDYRREGLVAHMSWEAGSPSPARHSD